MTHTSSETPSLYDRIGGETTVKSLVHSLYDAVLKDPELAPFFKNTTMAHLRHMQTEYFRAALDGPLTYAGLSMVKAHQGRGIQPKHFNRFAQHVLASLRSLNVTPTDTDAVVARINLLANEVTGNSASSD